MRTEWLIIGATILVIVAIITISVTTYGFGARCKKMFLNDDNLQMFCVDRMASGVKAEKVYSELSEKFKEGR